MTYVFRNHQNRFSNINLRLFNEEVISLSYEDSSWSLTCYDFQFECQYQLFYIESSFPYLFCQLLSFLIGLYCMVITSISSDAMCSAPCSSVGLGAITEE